MIGNIQYRVWISAVILLLFPLSAQGQTRLDQAMRLGRLDITNGLSQGMVFCMFQDSRGFMWFGTKEGLNRYDGHSIAVYRKRPGDSTSLPNNYVYAITEDRQGRLWLGTGGDGLIMFEPEQERFTRIPLVQDGSDTPVRNVDDVAVDSRGRLWVSAQAARLTLLDISGSDPEEIAASARFETPVRMHPSREVNRLRKDRFDRLWYITEKGLYRLNENNARWRLIVDATDLQPKNGKETVLAMTVADDRSIWLVLGIHAHSELLRVDAQGRQVLFRTRLRLENDHGYIRDLLGGPADVLFLLTDEHVIRYNAATGNYIATAADVERNGTYTGLGNHFFRSVDGMIWISTRGYGLNTFDPLTLAFNAHAGTINEALFGKEMAAFDRAIRTRTGGFTGLATGAYPIRVESGSVWCGTRDHGLLYYDAATMRVRQYGVVPHDPFSGMMIRLQRPFVDSRGRIWVGNRYGLSRLEEDTGVWHHYWYDGEYPDLTNADDHVTSYFEDEDGSLWLGTMSRGLAHFVPETGQFTFFQYDSDDPLSISHNHVLSLEADPLHPHRYLWVGTDGGGLNRFDLSGHICKRFDERTGFPSAVVYGLLTDAAGFIWMSTNEGIVRLDPRTQIFRQYEMRDGLQGNEFNRTEYYRVGDSLYFGGTKGYNSFLPRSIRDNGVVPNVVLTSLRLFNSPVTIGTPESPLGEAMPYARGITLPHDQNMISIEFASLDYHAPDKNRYRYRLAGLSDGWIDAGTARVATFTNLDPGEYEFHVVGSNNHGVWNSTGARFRITILSPWWSTSWAFIAYAILIIGTLVLVDRIQKKRLIARERERSQYREASLRAEAAELEARAVRAENERTQKEMQVASVIQQRVLPQQLPKIPGYDIAAINIPAEEIGGDYYDCIAMPDGRVVMVVADVTGKGVPASLLVNSLHAALRVHLDYDMDIISLVQHLNAFLYVSTPPNAFITFLIVMLDPEEGTLDIVNAGHNPALWQKNGSVKETARSVHLPLGCVKEMGHYRSERLDLGAGEGVLLFTDGITEAMNAVREPFGQEALESLVIAHTGDPASMMLGNIVAELQYYTQGAQQSDDITALFIRRLV